jgi:hypothetical protein
MPTQNYTSTYLDQESRDLAFGLPIISTELDSVRTYGWEVDFTLPPGVSLGAGADTNSTKRSLTLGAKSISEFGFNFQDIEVNRLNDKAYYPGKISNDEVTITFDNLLRTNSEYTTEGQLLLRYMGIVYNQDLGRSLTTKYKQTLRIKEFDTAGNVRAIYELIGAYPKSFKKAEKNYATGNEFDTIQMIFRFDFLRVLKGAKNTLAESVQIGTQE